MTLRIISGKFKGRRIEAPKTKLTRPTQEALRETVFNMCQNLIEGSAVLDLYAGSGAIGLEALSRGARLVTFVEKNRVAISTIHKNISLLELKEQTTVLSLDVLSSLKKLQGSFDFIYIDPPYDLPTDEVMHLIIQKDFLSQGGRLFLEERLSYPKKEPKSYPNLLHKKSKSVGAAQLHVYEKS